MIKTGIFGGSFNPIHNGHIALAKHILSLAGLDEIWFVVSPQNPFKSTDSDLLADHFRLELTRCERLRVPPAQALLYVAYAASDEL